MLTNDQLPLLQISPSLESDNTLQVNGRQYAIVTRGFLIKHQCLLLEDKRVWLTIKKKGGEKYRLQFARGNKYQLEVLPYATKAYVFYDQEDVEIFRVTQPPLDPNAVCLIVSALHIPEEEFVTLVAWGFYLCCHSSGRKHYKPAA
ncbi:MAG TPA: hypothetical protein VD794_13200 [Flavisolibacter sp.]|nr:hypothetical protein [Flavisolibacter sp.]